MRFYPSIALQMVEKNLLSIDLILLLVASVLGTSTQSINYGEVLAQVDNQSINLGSPIFIEHYNIISSKKTTVNGTEATEVVILGNGTINGINITSTGKALVLPRPNGVPYIEGAADFKAKSGNATYTFQAIGDYGAAFFNSNATGNLSFLNNMVGIYKVDRIERGDDVFTMWNWSSTTTN
jgi:hypothetical protein